MSKIKYEFVTTAGVGMEAGKTIEVESLHPSLKPHVRQISVAQIAEQEKEPEGPGADEPQKKEPVKKEPVKKPAKDDDDDNT